MTDIGVEINMSKSVVSGDRSQLEYAKRLFIDGKEITGLKFTILKAAATSINMLPDLIKVCKLRS
jgi:hypothetical protein